MSGGGHRETECPVQFTVVETFISEGKEWNRFGPDIAFSGSHDNVFVFWKNEGQVKIEELGGGKDRCQRSDPCEAKAPTHELRLLVGTNGQKVEMMITIHDGRLRSIEIHVVLTMDVGRLTEVITTKSTIHQKNELGSLSKDTESSGQCPYAGIYGTNQAARE